jgi:KDO2-lipid IV(A) lauroyltransferase
MAMSLSRFLQRKSNIFLYHNMGWQYALSYIRFLGKLYYQCNPREGRMIKKALRSVYGGIQTRSELKSTMRGVFQGIFSHYYEKVFNVHATTTTADRFYRTHIADRGLDVIRKGLSRGRGVLLITGHYGGVEFIPGYLSVNVMKP